MNSETFIKLVDLHKKVLSEIGSDRYQNITEGKSVEFKNGAMWGMAWLAMIANECDAYYNADVKEMK